MAGPSRVIVAGTSVARTTVASTAIASSMPTPINFMNVSPDSEKAPITTMSSSAAEVMMPPVRSSPYATASRSGRPARCASAIRDSRAVRATGEMAARVGRQA